MTSESVMLTYYRCTACSECFFSEGSFIHHAKKTHCKVLVSEGHDPGDDPDGARATPGRDSEVSARDLAEREVARATSEVMPKMEEQASCRGGGGYASVAPASVYQLQQDFIQPEQQRGESLEGAAYRAEEYGQAESGCQTLRHRSTAADPADEGQGHPPKVEMVDDSDEMDIMEILAPDGYSSLPPGGGDALAYSLVAPPYATTPPPPPPHDAGGAPLQQQQRPLEPRRCARCRKRFFTAFGFQRHKCNARNLARRHAARPLAVALPGGGGGGGGDADGGATVNALYEPRRGELVPMQGEPLRYDGPADDGGGGGGLVGGAGDTMMLAHGQPAMAADGADYWLGQQAGPSDTRRAKGREQWSVGGQGGMRAGVMTSYEEAQKHGMVELYKGYRVFVTQRQMIEILSKRKGEAAARCLLMTFYRKHELLGRNLTGRGSGTKSALDPAITKSIIAAVGVGSSVVAARVMSARGGGGGRGRAAGYRCEVCGVALRSTWHVNQHRLVSPECMRRFACATCGRRFARAYNLKVHERRHTDERPYVCLQCGSSFRQMGALVGHFKRKDHCGNPCLLSSAATSASASTTLKSAQRAPEDVNRARV